MSSEYQKKVAAQTAASNFTKHPKWLDPTDWTWKALYKNPQYELCRKVEGLKTRRPEDRYELPDYWQGKLGLYLFVLYVDRNMPRPSPFHLLRPMDESMQLYTGNMGWDYSAPGRRNNSAEAKAARAQFGTKSITARDLIAKELVWAAAPTEEEAWREREELCLCSPLTFSIGCRCRFAVEARYGSE